MIPRLPRHRRSAERAAATAKAFLLLFAIPRQESAFSIANAVESGPEREGADAADCQSFTAQVYSADRCDCLFSAERLTADGAYNVSSRPPPSRGPLIDDFGGFLPLAIARVPMPGSRAGFRQRAPRLRRSQRGGGIDMVETGNRRTSDRETAKTMSRAGVLAKLQI